MGNIEFDKRVRDLMEGHLEIPDAGSWERISSSLARRKRAKVLFMRRTIIATSAVAASLALLFFLDGGEMTTPQKRSIPDKLIVEATQPVTTTQPDVAAKQDITIQQNIATSSSKESHKAYKPSAKTGTKPVNAVKEISTGKAIVSDETKVVSDETKITNNETKIANNETKVVVDHQKPVTETNISNNSAKTSEVKKRDYLFDIKSRSGRRRSQSPLLALSTNISPSTASNSVTLMGLSQSQSDVVSNVMSTIQKAYVPQEVVSNTKFLMPISLGVQFQYPLSKRLYTATGLNYTLLFSHYDAISREQTRETQLTLHYIGIPLNLYYNLFNKESLRVYVSGGVAVEKGLYAYYKVFENGIRKSYGQSIDGLQWSMSGGLGAEFQVNKNAGLYFDPSIAYYFDNNQPLSIRSSQPLQFKFELGFRFHL